MIENLSALSGVAYEKLGAIFPSLVAPTPAPTRHIQSAKAPFAASCEPAISIVTEALKQPRLLVLPLSLELVLVNLRGRHESLHVPDCCRVADNPRSRDSGVVLTGSVIPCYTPSRSGRKGQGLLHGPKRVPPTYAASSKEGGIEP